MKRSRLIRWLKRHSLVPMVLVVVSVFAFAAVDLHAARDDSRWELVDLEGDREALEGLKIRGVLRDAYHSTSFSVTADGVAHETELFEVYREDPRYMALSSRIIGDHIYKVWNFEDRLLIARQSVRDPEDTESVMIEGYYAATDSRGQARYGNLVEYGLATSDGQVYYVTPTSLYYRGINVIYKLHYGAEQSKAEPLVELDMRDNDSERSRGLEVLGLEAAGDQLVLLMTEDQEHLIIRSYDSVTGELLGETAVRGFQPTRHSTSYLADVDAEGMKLNLAFPRHDEQLTEGQSAFTILSLDLTDGVRLLEQMRPVFTDGFWESWISQMAVQHTGDQLVVAMTVRAAEEDDSPYPNDFVRPIRFMIYVFEGSELVYRGELLTDQSDDYIYARNSQLSNRYSPNIYRFFDRLHIERIGRDG